MREEMRISSWKGPAKCRLRHCTVYSYQKKSGINSAKTTLLLPRGEEIRCEITIDVVKKATLGYNPRRRNLIQLFFWYEYQHLHSSLQLIQCNNLYSLSCTVLIQALVNFNKLPTTFSENFWHAASSYESRNTSFSARLKIPLVRINY